MPHEGTSCFAGSGSEFVTRMFAPGYGVPEDPATGSAAGPLACHLLRHGLVEAEVELAISQGEQVGRPSQLTAIVRGAPDAIEQVVVGGSAVVVSPVMLRISRGADIFGSKVSNCLGPPCRLSTTTEVSFTAPPAADRAAIR